MGTKSTQFRTRGDFDGENTSGKSGVSWNTAQLGTAAIFGIAATGGYIEDKIEGGKKYRIHEFGFAGYGPNSVPTSPYYAASPPTGWTFVVSNTGGLGGNIHYQVVGGGGGSGYPSAGGAGAGGFRTNFPGVVTDPTAPGGSVPLTGAAYPVSIGTYVVKVGDYGIYAGGSGAPGPTAGAAGGISEFYPSGQSFPHASYIRAYGGGMGSPPGSGYPGDTFGSGGGGGYPNYAGGPANGPSADPNHPIIQGYPGGNGPPNSGGDPGGGGGGGAGSAGSAGTPTGQGHGGIGVLSGIYPSPPTVNSGNGFYWAAGGGGGFVRNTGGAGDGGTGGGGGGGVPAPNPDRGGGGQGGIFSGNGSYSGGAGGAGATATGSGGGGVGNPTSYSDGRHGYGGRGCVIIRYEVAMAQPQ